MSRIRGTFQVFGYALVVGSAVIYEGCGGGSGDVSEPPGGAGPVDSLVLSVDSADVILGDTIRIVVEARDANGQAVPGVRLSYTSSDPAVATVTDDGLVTGVDFGVAQIEIGIVGQAGIAAASLAPSYAVITARPHAIVRIRSVPRVLITPGEQILDVGATSQYTADVTNIRGQGFTRVRRIWSSSDPSVASIDETGLVTAQNEGDTQITMTVIADGGLSVKALVLLHVAVCGGIFRVPSWSAAIDVSYKASGFVPGAQATYNVDQFSSSATQLERVPEQSDADSVIWEGKTSGGGPGTNQIGLDNVLTFPVPPPVSTGRTTESKNGVIQDGPTAIARLTVKRPAAGSSVCTYNLQYGDYFSWSVTNNQGAPSIPKVGPTATALLLGQSVGTPPADGRWVLGSFSSDSAIMLPARAFPDLTQSHYVAGSTIGASMIIALGGTSATWGEAKLVHHLQGTVR